MSHTIFTDGGNPGGKGRNQLDQQLGSLLEGWINRDTPDDCCRFCNDPLGEPRESPADRFCDIDCEEDFNTVLSARIALGKRDLNQRGFD